MYRRFGRCLPPPTHHHHHHYHPILPFRLGLREVSNLLTYSYARILSAYFPPVDPFLVRTPARRRRIPVESGCRTLNAGSSSSGYCRCCRRLKRHALCGTSLAASCCESLCRSKHSPQCHRQICCCLSARSWPLAVHQCQRRARGSQYRRRRHNSRRSHARSSPVAVVHYRRPAGPQEPNRPGINSYFFFI